MVLPEGFALPPLLYSLALLGGLLIVFLGLLRADPPITGWTVVAFVPWMAAGGALHVLHAEQLVASSMLPLLGTPAVYGFTALLAGSAWLLALRTPVRDEIPRPVPTIVAVLGVSALFIPTVVIIAAGSDRSTLSVFWPTVGFVGSILLAVGIWYMVVTTLPDVAETTGGVGFLLIFGHLLDGISTTIGIDILGAGERSPVPRMIMEFAGQLPTAPFIGTGWAFVVVKLAISLVILWLFTPFVRESPRQAYLLLAALIAVGLGPAVHNLLLFSVAG